MDGCITGEMLRSNHCWESAEIFCFVAADLYALYICVEFSSSFQFAVVKLYIAVASFCYFLRIPRSVQLVMVSFARNVDDLRGYLARFDEFIVGRPLDCETRKVRSLLDSTGSADIVWTEEAKQEFHKMEQMFPVYCESEGSANESRYNDSWMAGEGPNEEVRDIGLTWEEINDDAMYEPLNYADGAVDN